MDQLDSMKKARSILYDSIVEHKSLPPLRWIANCAGSIASSGLLEVSYMEDKGYTGWKYKFNIWKWDTFWPIYQKYGTSYRLKMDLSGKGWNDYDEDGIPYWEKWELVCACKNCDEDSHCPGCMDCDNDFIDEETGDAFRIIKK